MTDHVTDLQLFVSSSPELVVRGPTELPGSTLAASSHPSLRSAAASQLLTAEDTALSAVGGHQDERVQRERSCAVYGHWLTARGVSRPDCQCHPGDCGAIAYAGLRCTDGMRPVYAVDQSSHNTIQAAAGRRGQSPSAVK